MEANKMNTKIQELKKEIKLLELRIKYRENCIEQKRREIQREESEIKCLEENLNQKPTFLYLICKSFRQLISRE